MPSTPSNKAASALDIKGTHTSWNSSSVFWGVNAFNNPIICNERRNMMSSGQSSGSLTALGHFKVWAGGGGGGGANGVNRLAWVLTMTTLDRELYPKP